MEINKTYNGDCSEILKTLPENSVDSIVTDPPYELGFMGKSWDNTGIANNKEMWAECLRVLKPGGYLLSFGGTRTYHRMAVAIEDAGFEVRDMIEWVYGSGFPKSRNIGLDVDKRNGVTKNRGKAFVVAGQSGQRDKDTGGDLVTGSNTMGAYVAQNEWSGWGTALKPAHEPICMARKPLGYWETKNTLTAKEKDEFQDLWDKMEAGIPYDEKRYEELWAKKEVKVFKSLSVAENCLKYGTGGINIDESRVSMSEEDKIKNDKGDTSKAHENAVWENTGHKERRDVFNATGRFPANLIHDNSEEVRECFPETKSGALKPYKENHQNASSYKFEREKTFEQEANSGNASRFFKSIIYQAKASKSERNKGCENMDEQITDDGREKKIDNPFLRGKTLRTNNHPTVKPIALMEYLIKMVTPKGGVILDPFAGSGSTLVAAKQNGFQYIGIEMTAEYIPIIEARLNGTDNTLF